MTPPPPRREGRDFCVLREKRVVTPVVWPGAQAETVNRYQNQEKLVKLEFFNFFSSIVTVSCNFWRSPKKVDGIYWVIFAMDILGLLLTLINWKGVAKLSSCAMLSNLPNFLTQNPQITSANRKSAIYCIICKICGTFRKCDTLWICDLHAHLLWFADFHKSKIHALSPSQLHKCSNLSFYIIKKSFKTLLSGLFWHRVKICGFAICFNHKNLRICELRTGKPKKFANLRSGISPRIYRFAICTL